MQTLERSLQKAENWVNDELQSEEVLGIPQHSPVLVTKELIDQRANIRDQLSRAVPLTKSPECRVFRVDKTKVVKTGENVRMDEALAMKFVSEKTSLPVPKVLDAYIDTETSCVCIVMEYIDGRPLDKEWDSYDEIQKQGVESQLKQLLVEMRQIQGTFVGSVDGSHCNDQLFDDVPTLCGPFDSEKSFHEGLIHVMKEKGSWAWNDMVIRFLRAIPPHKIVLTHNDIAPRNILVRNAEVVGIVDWEFSGFYPEYWEYVKALCFPDWKSSWIKEGVVDKILDPYLLELAYMMHARDIIWGF